MSLRVRKNRAVVPASVAALKQTKARSIEDCPLNTAMELLGGAWATHVIWYLSAQPRRFGELRIDIPAISARVLSQRLRELEAKGVVDRTVVDSTPPSAEYALTKLGRDLVPAVAAIAAVGEKLDRRATRAPKTRHTPPPNRG